MIYPEPKEEGFYWYDGEETGGRPMPVWVRENPSPHRKTAVLIPGYGVDYLEKMNGVWGPRMREYFGEAPEGSKS